MRVLTVFVSCWFGCDLQEKWEEGYYITAMAGSMSSASLVVMSKGTPYTQQSYKVINTQDCLWLLGLHAVVGHGILQLVCSTQLCVDWLLEPGGLVCWTAASAVLPAMLVCFPCFTIHVCCTAFMPAGQ